MQTNHPEIYIQVLTSILIITISISMIVVLIILYQKRKLQQKKELALLKTQLEKELLTAKLEIQEDLQRNLSMEIHDNVGQSLLLANVNLTILQNSPTTIQDDTTLITETKNLISKSMEDISFLSRSMNPDRIVELGVISAIGIELEHLQKKKLFEVTIENNLQNDQLTFLHPDTEIILFRIYQEAIKNIIKYAYATKIRFELAVKENQLTLKIADNGIGFDMAKQATFNGIGLRNMQKRVTMFEGRMNLSSVPGQGTSIEIWIPLKRS